MALTSTTLAVAMTATDQAFSATSATGATVGGFARIENEWTKITEINGVRISVIRGGFNGSAVVAHNILAPVVFGLTTDAASLGVYETLPVPGIEFDVVNIGANGTIPVPKRPTRYFINKATALASSPLANPAADQNGLIVSFTNTTDAAHVVTVTNGHDGTTGTHTTLTSPALAGGTLTLVGQNAKWYVLANNLWVIT